MAKSIPTDGRTITYRREPRKCGKQSCHCSRDETWHGLYIYAYWHDDDGRLQSAYVGKVDTGLPNVCQDCHALLPDAPGGKYAKPRKYCHACIKKHIARSAHARYRQRLFANALVQPERSHLSS